MSLIEATPAVEKPVVQLGCPDVRLGRPEDRPAILDLCYRLADENAVFPTDPAKVEDRIDRALSRETGSLMGVSVTREEGNEILAGAICLDMVSLWYSTVPFIADVFAYVAPEHRKSNLARQQLRFAKKVADEFGMPLFLSIMTTIRTQEKMRLYEAEGFKSIGGQFVHIPLAIRPLFKESWSFKDG